MRKSLYFAFLGLFLGIALTTVTSLFAQMGEDKPPVDLIGGINKLVNSMCTVYVGYGRPTFNGRCSRSEVMTGINNDYIYCSEISVECMGKHIVIDATE